jgi:hypothetical protein
MVEGSLDTLWSSKPRRGPTGQYRVLFISLQSPGGAVRQQKVIIGEENLTEFFLKAVLDQKMSPERAKARADEWLKEVHLKGSLSLNPVMITTELFGKLTVS